MKLKLNVIGYLVLFGIIVALSFRKSKPLKPEVITKIDTITRIETVYIPKDSIIYRDTGSTKLIFKIDSFPVPAIVDTQAILADYKRKRVYNDVLINDSTGFVQIIDTVQFNRIIGRYKRITIYTYSKKILPKQNWHFYIGASVGGSLNNFDVYGLAVFQSRKKTLYITQYGILTKTIQLGVGFKLK